MTAPDDAPPREDKTPYGDAAERYWTAGWRGILPLPAHAKKHPPKGYTGADGAWPSFADVYTWTEDRPDGNICLRLPPDVIGIDVDHYGNKPGGLVLGQHETNLGQLPATWRTTSRDDGVSGIRLYRIPAGLRWPGILGPGIETVRHEHRYALVWPSIHPDTGGTYRWINPDGHTAIGEIPTIEDLPDLPDTWIEHFTGGELADEQHKAALTDQATREWLNQRAAGTPCRHTQHALSTGLPTITTGESRHDAALKLTNRLIWTAGEGHTGALQALTDVRAVFLKATAGDRGTGEAEAEWDRMITGAVARAAHAHPKPGADPCDLNFLIPRKDQPCPTPTDTTRTDAPSSTTSTASPQPSNNSPTTTTLPLPNNDSPAPTSSGSTSTNEDDYETPPTWGRIDLGPYLDGTYKPITPTLFTRTDGIALLYPGRTHSFHGESESGKSLITQIESARLIAQGQDVLYLDFEDDAPSVVERLLLFGATAPHILDHFDYRKPEVKPSSSTEELEAWFAMLAGDYDLVVIDGVTDSLGIFGYSSLDNDEITAWMRQFPRNLAKQTGAAVVVVDHVVKNGENRGRFAVGGQAKMNGLTGAGYMVEILKPLGRGLRGVVALRVAKDRGGYIRPRSGPMRSSDRSQETCKVIVDSTDVDHPTVTIEPPEQVTHADGSPPDPTRFTGLMEKISKLLEKTDSPLSGRQVRELVSGRPERIQKALTTLVDEDFVTVEPGPRNSVLHSSEREYRQHDDPKSDLYQGVDDLVSRDRFPVVPDRFPVVPGTGHVTGSRPAPSPTGAGTGQTHSTDPQNDASGSHPDEAFCKHCGTDITEDLKHAPKLTRCRHCRHLTNGSERDDQ